MAATAATAAHPPAELTPVQKQLRTSQAGVDAALMPLDHGALVARP